MTRKLALFTALLLLAACAAAVFITLTASPNLAQSPTPQKAGSQTSKPQSSLKTAQDAGPEAAPTLSAIIARLNADEARIASLESAVPKPEPPLPGKPIFPADNPWNQDISQLPVDPNSDALIAAMNPSRALHPDFGAPYNGAPNGIPYVLVPGNQPRVPMSFDYADQSDPGPYPIPPGAPIEGGSTGDGDRHILVIDTDHWKLYETWDSHPDGKGGWRCGSGAIFDLSSNTLRPASWGSADAAGLPIFPGLIRYDELADKKEIDHALRFTVHRTRRAYVSPARHYASKLTDPNLPPMGMRVRLKASVDISHFSPTMQVLMRAMKKYGLILADNGSDWFLSGTPDPRWDDDDLHSVNRLHGSDFEVVKMGEVVTH